MNYIWIASIVIVILIILAVLHIQSEKQATTKAKAVSQQKDGDGDAVVKGIFDSYNRSPKNRDMSTYAKRFNIIPWRSGQKEGFRNVVFDLDPLVKHIKRVKEPFVPMGGDFTNTTEYIFWKQLLNEGVISVAEFNKLLLGSEERQKVISDEIKKQYTATVGSVEFLSESEYDDLYQKYLPTYKFSDDMAKEKLISDIKNLPSVKKLVSLSEQWVKYNADSGGMPLGTRKKALGVFNGNVTAREALNVDPSFLANSTVREILNRDGVIISPSDVPVGSIIEDNIIKMDDVVRYTRLSSGYGIALTTKRYRIYLRRLPTSSEISTFMKGAVDSSGNLTDGEAESAFKNSEEFINLSSIVQQEIRESYLNENYVPIPVETLANLTTAILGTKTHLRNDIPKLVIEQETDSARAENLRKTIRTAYLNSIGREPSNEFLDYWIQIVDSNSTDVLASAITDVFYKGAVRLSSNCIAFMRKKTYDCINPITWKITGTQSYINLVGKEYAKDFGAKLLTVTNSPVEDAKLWFILSDGTVTTVNRGISRDEEKRVTNSITKSSTYLGELFTKYDLNSGNLAGICPHYLPDRRKKEVLVFMKDGRYFPWNVVTGEQRFDASIPTSNTFGEMEIDLADVSDVFTWPGNETVVGFVMNTNDIYLWDTAGKKEWRPRPIDG